MKKLIILLVFIAIACGAVGQNLNFLGTNIRAKDSIVWRALSNTERQSLPMSRTSQGNILMMGDNGAWYGYTPNWVLKADSNKVTAGNYITWKRFTDSLSTHYSKTAVDTRLAAKATPQTVRDSILKYLAQKKDYGFVDNTQTSISFDTASKTFTLTDAGAGWDYFRAGVPYHVHGTKTTTLSGTPPTAGIYYIVIDNATGTLSNSGDAWTLEDTKVPVALIYWNNYMYEKYYMADERHSFQIPRLLHHYLHATIGARYESGGVMADYVVPPAAPTGDDDNTFSLTQTKIEDDALDVTLAQLTDPAGGSDAAYRVAYRTGASTWVIDSSSVPFIYSATYLRYDNGGSLATASNGYFVNYYLLFTNYQGSARYLLIPGRSQFTTAALAYQENVQGFTFTGLSIAEAVIAYQLTFQASNSYSTKGKCKLTRAPVRINIGLAAATVTVAAETDPLSFHKVDSLTDGGAETYYHARTTYLDWADTTTTPGLATQYDLTQVTGATTLDALTNVYTAGKADNDIIYWDAGTSMWRDTTFPAGTGGVTSVSGTSPVASSGGTTPAISIIADTLTSWRTKQNQGAAAFGWGNHAGLYPLKADSNKTSTGNYVTMKRLLDSLSTHYSKTATDTRLGAKLDKSDTSNQVRKWIYHTAGDIVYGTGYKTYTRLAKGSASQVLHMNGDGSAPEWFTPPWIYKADSATEAAGNYTTRKYVRDTYAPKFTATTAGYSWRYISGAWRAWPDSVGGGSITGSGSADKLAIWSAADALTYDAALGWTATNGLASTGSVNGGSFTNANAANPTLTLTNSDASGISLLTAKPAIFGLSAKPATVMGLVHSVSSNGQNAVYGSSMTGSGIYGVSSAGYAGTFISTAGNGIGVTAMGSYKWGGVFNGGIWISTGASYQQNALHITHGTSVTPGFYMSALNTGMVSANTISGSYSGAANEFQMWGAPTFSGAGVRIVTSFTGGAISADLLQIKDASSGTTDTYNFINALKGTTSKFKVNKDGNIYGAGTLDVMGATTIHSGAALNLKYAKTLSTSDSVLVSDAGVVKYRLASAISAAAPDTLIWRKFAAAYASTSTATLTGTQALADAMVGSLVRWENTDGVGRFGHITAATYATGNITVTLRGTAACAASDKNYYFAPNIKDEAFAYRITIPGEQIADASNPQGMWFQGGIDTLYVFDCSAWVLTAAAGAGAACAFNVYYGATNIFSSAIDLTTTTSSLNNIPNTTVIPPSQNMTLRITASAGATNKASNFQARYYAVPSRIFYR